MGDQPPAKQTPEQREELRETANRCQEASDRLAEYGIVFGVNYQCNIEQPDGSVVDGLGIILSLGAKLAMMEMMADWYDAKERAIESGKLGRFMNEALDLQDGPVN
jgi:hypothetical protein